MPPSARQVRTATWRLARALMLLTEARRTARVSASGELVTLVEQDRGTWDAALIAEGHRLVRERLAARVG